MVFISKRGFIDCSPYRLRIPIEESLKVLIERVKSYFLKKNLNVLRFPCIFWGAFANFAQKSPKPFFLNH